jgi:hypothetical protein
MSESIPEGILDLIPIQLESPIMRENNPEHAQASQSLHSGKHKGYF